SEPAKASALEVLAAHGVEVMVDEGEGYTPTPVISHAILKCNRGRTSGLADGMVITPSHNPPEDGGFKYNPPHGGPADSRTTSFIQEQANQFLKQDLSGVRRILFEQALEASHPHDYIAEYAGDLQNVLDFDAIREVDFAIDPLGGA